MFRKIDRWIGRHMSAKRWVVLWVIVVVMSSTVVGSGWLWALPMGFIGAVMFFGNLERLK